MTEACIDIYSGDLESAQVYHSKMVTARKEHSCYECENIIKVGQKYEQVDAVYEGEWEHFKTCTTCVNIRRNMFCNGFPHGAMWECIHEHRSRDL